MTKRTYTQKDGTIWEWEETNELVELLKQLHQTQRESNKSISST
jgi:hypothetical protein